MINVHLDPGKELGLQFDSNFVHVLLLYINSVDCNPGYLSSSSVVKYVVCSKLPSG